MVSLPTTKPIESHQTTYTMSAFAKYTLMTMAVILNLICLTLSALILVWTINGHLLITSAKQPDCGCFTQDRFFMFQNSTDTFCCLQLVPTKCVKPKESFVQSLPSHQSALFFIAIILITVQLGISFMGAMRIKFSCSFIWSSIWIVEAVWLVVAVNVFPMYMFDHTVCLP